MLGMAAELMLHRQFKFGNGRIKIFNRYSSILPSDSIVNIQKELEKIGKEHIIYYEGKRSGKFWFEEMNRVYNLKKKDVIKWGSDVVTMAGWGQVEKKSIDEEKKIVVFSMKNSVVCDFYGKGKHAVDHLFRGLLCGAMCFIFKTDMDAVETKCRAKGDRSCEFVVKPSKDFDRTNPLVKKQLPLK